MKKGWGNLPQARIDAVKNLLNKKYPPHYQRAIEAYSKALAKRKAATK